MDRKSLIIGAILLTVLGFIIIPGIKRAKIASNSGSTAAFLDSLSSKQELFRRDKVVDQDKDNVGEYGLLGEIAGFYKARGSDQNTNAISYLTKDSLVYRNGYYYRDGYHFQLFLPHAKQVITDTGYMQDSSKHKDSINAQESRWVAYAWPVEYGVTGVLVYAIDQSTQLYLCGNKKGEKIIYHDQNQPQYYSAMRENAVIDPINWEDLGNHNQHMDGLNWSPQGY